MRFAQARAMMMVLALAVSASPSFAATKQAAPAPAPPAPVAQAAQGAIAPEDNLFNPNTQPPDINAIPALTSIVKSGGKLYYMGERSGLFGWFIVKDAAVQMIYASADGKTTLIGAMFTGAGESVTGPQIERLTQSNKEVAAFVGNNGQQQGEIMKAGANADGFAAVPAGTSAGQNPASPPPGAVPGQVPGLAAMPSVTMSPGEQLLQDLQAAAGVTLGKNDNAQISIVVSPDCPFCQKTWRELHDQVAQNVVQVRLVPMGDPGSNNERAAAMLLKAANPMDAWDKYVGGDKTALAGDPDDVRLRAVQGNRILVDRWNIRATPYLVYRAKDGRVKIVQGRPERIAAVLNDLIK